MLKIDLSEKSNISVTRYFVRRGNNRTIEFVKNIINATEITTDGQKASRKKKECVNQKKDITIRSGIWGIYVNDVKKQIMKISLRGPKFFHQNQ